MVLSEIKCEAVRTICLNVGECYNVSTSHCGNIGTKIIINTSLAAPGALTNRLQRRRTARKASEANLDPPNQKSEITSL